MKLHALPSVTLDGVVVTLSSIGEHVSTLVSASMTREEAARFHLALTDALAAVQREAEKTATRVGHS